MSDLSSLPNGQSTFPPSGSIPSQILPQPIPPPPEVEATLARLSAYRHVRGVMILSRSPVASSSSATATTSTTTDATLTSIGSTGGATSTSSAPGGIVQATGPAFEGEAGRRYAKALENIVGVTAKAVAGCDEGDEVKLMRIRTKKHELILTPDERYLLVVLQDPQ